MKYEMETMREIWPGDGDGERIEVGPDRDGLGLVEIRMREEDNTVSNRIIIAPEGATLIATALCACANEIEKRVIK